jgi:hypothetical protein
VFSTVAKLKKLLSAENILYLDELLQALTEREGSPVYDKLWSWFTQRFPRSPTAANHAWGALRMLHSIVKEYREKKGI